MNIPSLFISRPVMTTLVMAAVLVAGYVGYTQLPVSDLPNVDYPVISVSANLPGASPETMASAVATVLEKQFSSIAGVDSMSSTSQQGSTSITLTFVLDRNIDAAAQDVQAAIAKVARQLPADMPAPPTYDKVNPADRPIILVALVGASIPGTNKPALPMSVLDEYGQTMMAQRISTLSGVAQVQVYGSQKYAVRIQVNPQWLFYRGMGMDQVSAAINAANVNLPTGILYGMHTAFTVEATGQLLEASEYEPLVVFRNGTMDAQGSVVRLKDIAAAKDGVENDKTAAWYVDKNAQRRAIILAVRRQPGTNTVEVAQRVRDLLPVFRDQLPASVEMQIIFDTSVPIKESVQDVKFTLLLTLGLVVFIIFVFLRNVSATIIPSLALPMSIVGTFAVMYLLGYNLDNLSLMALTLAVGFVVDDAVVMLENIVRHTEMGKERMEASIQGSKEIGFTIVSMTLSLSAVFIPVLFMAGVMGRLFREFSVTIGAAVLVSGFVSLTLTPMLCSRFLKPAHKIHHGHIFKVSEAIFQLAVSFYGATLRPVLKHRIWALLVALAMLPASWYFLGQVKKGFIPSEDRSQLMIQTEAKQGISFDSMVLHQQAVATLLQQHPDVEAFMSSAGARGSSGANIGTMFIRLRPRADRTKTADEIVNELRPKLNQIPGIRVNIQNPPVVNVGGRQSRAQYQYTMQSYDTAELFKYGAEMERRMKDLKGLVDVSSDLQLKNPKVTLDIDRDKASTLGITVEQIETALYNAYGSRQITTIFAPSNQYQVILEMMPEFQLDPEALGLLYVRSAAGNLVPLNTLATFKQDVGPMSVSHTGQLSSVTVAFNLGQGVSLGEATDRVSALAREVLPASIMASFQGTAQEFQKSLGSMLPLLGFAVLVIYIVLGILYESFIHPITILSALPFAAFGALATLVIFNVELGVYGFVGMIMLIGLVKKNGIMMVDFAIAAQREQGLSPREAIHQACVVRFRPIMMTTMAALMAGIPIAVGYGAGGEARQPLGMAVVGGLVFSQLLTLYVTPVFYTYMESLRGLLTRKPKPAKPA